MRLMVFYSVKNISGIVLGAGYCMQWVYTLVQCIHFWNINAAHPNSQISPLASVFFDFFLQCHETFLPLLYLFKFIPGFLFISFSVSENGTYFLICFSGSHHWFIKTVTYFCMYGSCTLLHCCMYQTWKWYYFVFV